MTSKEWTDEFVKALTAPFPRAEWRWVVVATNKKAVEKDRMKTPSSCWSPYVDARQIQERLDAVCGPDGWSVDFIPTQVDSSLVCRLTILGITKADVGDGHQPDNSDIAPLKAAASDGIKRAAVVFGIGRHLGREKNVWRPTADGAPGTKPGAGEDVDDPPPAPAPKAASSAAAPKTPAPADKSAEKPTTSTPWRAKATELGAKYGLTAAIVCEALGINPFNAKSAPDAIATEIAALKVQKTCTEEDVWRLWLPTLEKYVRDNKLEPVSQTK